MDYPKHNRQLMWLQQAFSDLRHALTENLFDFYKLGFKMHYYDERQLVQLVRDARDIISKVEVVANSSGKPLSQMELEYDNYMQLRSEKIKADADDARADEREESEE